MLDLKEFSPKFRAFAVECLNCFVGFPTHFAHEDWWKLWRDAETIIRSLTKPGIYLALPKKAMSRSIVCSPPPGWVMCNYVPGLIATLASTSLGSRLTHALSHKRWDIQRQPEDDCSGLLNVCASSVAYKDTPGPPNLFGVHRVRWVIDGVLIEFLTSCQSSCPGSEERLQVERTV